jgi:hypothetical protein
MTKPVQHSMRLVSVINKEVMSDDNVSVSANSESLEDSSTKDYTADQNAVTDEDEQLHLLHKKDSTEVSRWRGMVIIMLLFTASLVITTTYIFLSKEETDEFEKSVSLWLWRLERYPEERKSMPQVTNTANMYCACSTCKALEPSTTLHFSTHETL